MLSDVCGPFRDANCKKLWYSLGGGCMRLKNSAHEGAVRAAHGSEREEPPVLPKPSDLFLDLIPWSKCIAKRRCIGDVT